MIEIQNLSLQRGGKALLEQASLRINPGERVALVGANGSGKSSLFALLAGELGFDGGELSLPPTWQIAQMRQEVTASDRPAVDYVIDGHRRFREVEAAIAECDDDHRLAELHGELDTLRAYQIRSDAERLLQGLGDKGITVVLVTHEPDIAQHAGRVVTLRDGLIRSDIRQQAVAA